MSDTASRDSVATADRGSTNGVDTLRPASIALFLLGGAWGLWCGWNSPGWEFYALLGLAPISLYLASDHLALSLGGPLLWSMTTCGAAFARAPAGPHAWLIHVILETILLCLACYFFRRWRRAEAETARMRLIDPLTGLWNRAGFLQQLHRAVERSNRDRQGFAVGVLDLDRFKPVNDRLGHAAGDQVLQTVGRLIAAHLTTQDQLGRFGGDEFALLLAADDPASVTTAATSILSDLRSAGLSPANEPLTASLGIVVVQNQNADSGTVLNRADRLMYRAKRSGRDRFEIQVDSAEMAESPSRRPPADLNAAGGK